MLRVESGQSLGGRCWVSPGGRPVTWIDKRMEGGEWGLEWFRRAVVQKNSEKCFLLWRISGGGDDGCC
ncbi:hypothetical protein CO053_01385 [Candidatus Shapirobacteria bacterium CG_4_9_14_0_2_um_filter_40_11]|uniref:Uncharacterized protein n=1 Tax=Candidatus Shapirobacteria bacterium CG_4_9_14_0_2_um_filter_40_11 TaxID=1974876 RepID=A0A2M8EV86_9BACT|nr:MAG: hypothetical protein CO053_01385 [Candidatus Shapirobacteria bacterium CG_4_9_14_0_2_um_filter_40_11]